MALVARTGTPGPMAGVSTLKFRAGVVPTLATLVLLALLCTLGVWQLGRADYKDGLFADVFASAAPRPPHRPQ